MKIRSPVVAACAALPLLICAPSRGAPQSVVSPVSFSHEVPRQPSRQLTWLDSTAPIERDIFRHPVSTDSMTRSHRRAAIVGGSVGAVVGGLSSAAYILNATAYRCVGFGQCPDNPHTGRRVVVITAGTVAGAGLGAWIGHRLAKWRSN